MVNSHYHNYEKTMTAMRKSFEKLGPDAIYSDTPIFRIYLSHPHTKRIGLFTLFSHDYSQLRAWTPQGLFRNWNKSVLNVTVNRSKVGVSVKNDPDPVPSHFSTLAKLILEIIMVFVNDSLEHVRAVLWGFVRQRVKIRIQVYIKWLQVTKHQLLDHHTFYLETIQVQHRVVIHKMYRVWYQAWIHLKIQNLLFLYSFHCPAVSFQPKYQIRNHKVQG